MRGEGGAHWAVRRGVQCDTPEYATNPLSPGVLDPGNSPGGGGPQDPQLYFAFFGLFYAP